MTDKTAALDAFVWLIEAPGPNYLATRNIGHYPDFFWSKDPLRAVRFVSHAQADGVMEAVRRMAPELWAFAVNLGEARPVEHKFMDNRPTAPVSHDAGVLVEALERIDHYMLVIESAVRTADPSMRGHVMWALRCGRSAMGAYRGSSPGREEAPALDRRSLDQRLDDAVEESAAAVGQRVSAAVDEIRSRHPTPAIRAAYIDGLNLGATFPDRIDLFDGFANAYIARMDKAGGAS